MVRDVPGPGGVGLLYSCAPPTTDVVDVFRSLPKGLPNFRAMELNTSTQSSERASPPVTTYTQALSNRASAQEKLEAFIADKNFPCVGAKSALNKGRMRFGEFGRMGEKSTAAALVDALEAYSSEFSEPGNVPVSFIALFDQMDGTELEFETLLWKQLQALHEVDRSRGRAWDARVNSDPSRDDFSFSVAGRGLFVVGLHPRASRLARQAPVPCLVFNFHDQFETLKASGKYQSMQEAIRARDVVLQGSVNPVLAGFGESSEARQYSGRAVEKNWKCPFHHQPN